MCWFDGAAVAACLPSVAQSEYRRSEPLLTTTERSGQVSLWFSGCLIPEARKIWQSGCLLSLTTMMLSLRLQREACHGKSRRDTCRG